MKKLSNWLLAVVVLFALIMRGPALYEQFRQQGTFLHPIVLEGKLFPPPGSKSILIFWASWCGPCTIELNRIESALSKNEISPNNIYAINLGETKDVVNEVIKKRHFKIPVVLDEKGELANLLNVKATPTIAFIDEKGKITWLTTGLSPSLIYRIKSFQKD